MQQLTFVVCCNQICEDIKCGVTSNGVKFAVGSILRVFVRVSKRKDPPVLEDTCEGRKDARFVSYSLNGTEDGVLVAVPN
jgi:hypothetical protein